VESDEYQIRLHLITFFLLICAIEPVDEAVAAVENIVGHTYVAYTVD
jgi:hypothetical protein